MAARQHAAEASGRRFAAQVDQYAEHEPTRRGQAPGHALAELGGDRAGADVGHGPADAEEHRADHVLAPRPDGGPAHRLAGQHGTRLEALQQPQADERGRQRGGEEEHQVGVAEEQAVAQDVGARHARPRQRQAEHRADGERREAPHSSASIRKLTAIAVPKNVAVATRLAGESTAFPLSPLPDVQPPASLAP